jgi:hypothetical protein
VRSLLSCPATARCRGRAIGVAVLVACALWSVPVGAQETEPPDPAPQEAPKITSVQRQRFWTGLSVGVGWEKVVTTSGHASNPFPYRFLFRNPSKSGWAFTPMFGWFGTDIDAVAVGSPHTPLGKLTVRPVMVGVRRTWARRPMSYDLAAVAGPSFNSFKVADAAQPLLGLGSGRVSSDANVSFAWRIQASTWHDITDRVAVRGSIAYVWNQAEITFDGGTSGRRISQSANSAQFGFGVVYRIF